jgi:hypothetical protein
MVLTLDFGMMHHQMLNVIHPRVYAEGGLGLGETPW